MFDEDGEQDQTCRGLSEEDNVYQFFKTGMSEVSGNHVI